MNNKGKSDAARGFRCSKAQLTPLGHAGPPWVGEWNLLFNKPLLESTLLPNVEDQGQTETHSGGTWASDEHNPREFLSVKPYQSLWFPYWYNKIHWLCVFVCVCYVCVWTVWAGIRWALSGGITLKSWLPLVSSVSFSCVVSRGLLSKIIVCSRSLMGALKGRTLPLSSGVQLKI